MTAAELDAEIRKAIEGCGSSFGHIRNRAIARHFYRLAAERCAEEYAQHCISDCAVRCAAACRAIGEDV